MLFAIFSDTAKAFRLSSTVFAEGFRPAVDLGLSLSIVGGRAQPPILKELTLNLRADHARYMEILRLSKMGSGLSEEAEDTIRRGDAIMSILQQGQYCPVSLAEECLLLYALSKDRLTTMSKDDRNEFVKGVFRFAEENYQSTISAMEEALELTPEIEGMMTELLDDFFAREAT